VLRGQCRVEIAAPPPRARKTRTKVRAVDALDDGLYETLRSLRKALADESGVPPYVVFHDSSLREMAQRRPATLDEFAAIPGVGHKKLNRYGQRFLDAIRENASRA
jgi:ATP-dependent DNA helicase RecQ